MTEKEKRDVADEIWELVRANERSVKELHAHGLNMQTEFERSRKEFDRRLREIRDEDSIRSQKIKDELAVWSNEIKNRLSEISRELTGVGHNNGAFAEEYFVNALKKSMTFGGMFFDEIYQNISTMRNKVRDEFDIVMINPSAVALIEVKYRVQCGFLQTLVTKKVENFRLLLPDYADRDIYLGIGSMSFTGEVLVTAQELGIGTLRQVGETIEYNTNNLKIY
ncbi:hypothetical protein FACS1894170_08070 [Planctomycetales bacterium]|nr:hypothetical protein FACS1894170_08070 [Planctomycetales bacterium]